MTTDMARRLGLLACSVLLFGVASAHDTKKIEGTCCGVNFIGSGNKVVLEGQPLAITNITLRAAQVRVCADGETWVQIWRKHGVPEKRLRVRRSDEEEPTYSLVWQHLVSARMSEISAAEWILVQFPEPVHLVSQSGDLEFYLGLYSPGEKYHSLPSVFTANSADDEDSAPELHVYVSNDKFTDALIVNSAVQFDQLLWPFIFSPSAKLCTDIRCAHNPLQIIHTAVVAGARGPPGPPGPAGPPGASGSGSGSGPGTGSGTDGGFGDGDGAFPDIKACDIPEDITNTNKDMLEKIDRMSSKIDDLTNSNLVTGLCPPGWTPGEYGLGNCYKIFRENVSYGKALVNCREHRSLLVQINTAQEDEFLRQTIRSRMSSEMRNRNEDIMESYWSAGLWSRRNNQWVWYRGDQYAPSDRISHQNWKGGVVPESDSLNDCVALMVSAKRQESYWESANCYSARYYICEINKQCL